MSENCSKVSWIMETNAKKEDCILSLYASDGAIIPDYSLKNILRISPFSNPMAFHSRTAVKNYKEIIEFDEKDKIFYVHLGSEDAKYKNAFLSNDAFKWPSEYTILMWIRMGLFAVAVHNV